jgi:prepilin-type N-terminal cleavage/methylation domain-containing protein
MRKDKEKKTANLRHWLRRIHRCCSQKCRCDLRARGGGFTLIEILLVVVIIAIAAMIAVPMMGSMDSVQIRSAANMIAADLEYAKSMAISRGQNYSVVFDKTTESYQIFKDEGGTLVPIEHPVKKRFDYKVDFSSDSRLDKVVIDDADFDPDSSNTITFDYLGSPYSGSGTSNPLNSGTISIRAGDFTETISVEPITGFISIAE